MRSIIGTIFVQQASSWEGFVRAFDVFGVMGPRIDSTADPFEVDRGAIRSNWEKVNIDLKMPLDGLPV